MSSISINEITLWQVFLIWFAVAFLLGVIVGKCIKFGNRVKK